MPQWDHTVCKTDITPLPWSPLPPEQDIKSSQSSFDSFSYGSLAALMGHIGAYYVFLEIYLMLRNRKKEKESYTKHQIAF